MALQEDKHNYETTAKESLRRVLQEKIEVVRKLAEVEVGHKFACYMNAHRKYNFYVNTLASLFCWHTALP